MGGLDPVASLEVALRQVIPDLHQLGLRGAELEGQSPQRDLCVCEVTAVELAPGARELQLRLGRGRHLRRMMARHETEQRDQAEPSQGPHGDFGGVVDGASAFPTALIFSCARCAIVSPGVPPAIACW